MAEKLLNKPMLIICTQSYSSILCCQPWHVCLRPIRSVAGESAPNTATRTMSEYASPETNIQEEKIG
jgi:hypothetical protein